MFASRMTQLVTTFHGDLIAADEVRHESALLYPQLSWEELGGRFLGLMAYLRFERILGDQSMPGKQRPCPGVRGGALRDPRNMVRAGLPEAKSPDDASRHPPERRLNRCRALPRYHSFADATSGVRAMPSEGIQGDELAAYVPLDTYDKDERGIAYGTRVLWRRRPRSSRRSHDLPRSPGEPESGRRGPGGWTPPTREVGVMPNAETVLGVPRGDGGRCQPAITVLA